MGLHRVFLLCCLLLAGTAGAAPPPQATREIEQLITALGESGCEFQRNGHWYPATKAGDHLRRKYDWLRERDMIHGAEEFIDSAGTRSSMSGRAYQVRCPGRPVEPSASWLRARLAELRRRTPASR
ncbi:YfeK family protein [Lysobacter fragariae]